MLPLHTIQSLVVTSPITSWVRDAKLAPLPIPVYKCEIVYVAPVILGQIVRTTSWPTNKRAHKLTENTLSHVLKTTDMII